MTPTGRATSEALYGDAVERIYLPYDTLRAARRFLRPRTTGSRPDHGTETRPNLIAARRREGVLPISSMRAFPHRSARRYARFPSLTRSACLASPASAQSTTMPVGLSSWVPEPPSVTGNMKFDAVAPESQLRLAEDSRRLWGQRHRLARRQHARR